MTDVRTNGVRSSAIEFGAKIEAVAFDRWFAGEITAARQYGYATRLADEQHGIEAGSDWIRGVRADAWDRGYAAGASDDFTNQPHQAENPYRRQENDDE